MDAAKSPQRLDGSHTWGQAMQGAVCPHCDWRYLLLEGAALPMCPHCYQAQLTVLDDAWEGLSGLRPPELFLPFSLDAAALERRVAAFAEGIPFPPYDLNTQALRSRLRALYLPVWLVDVGVDAAWQGEAGFDYEVVSHQDRFDDRQGGWMSHEVKEKRVRWEPRMGRLRRTYSNVLAPALEEDAVIRRRLGGYDLKAAQPYDADALARSMVRLPNRAPEDAWSDALPKVQALATDECRHAAQADHFRAFRWTPAYADQNWTLMLLPVYATYYLDDAQQPQPVLVHGRKGTVSGVRRASMQRAQRTSLIIGLIAMIVFVLSVIGLLLGAVVPPVAILGGIGLVVAVLVGLGAAIPIVSAWRFNRTLPEV